MKALSDVKLAYLIRKIKDTFSLKDHTHDNVRHAETAGTANTATNAEHATVADTAVYSETAGTAETVNKASYADEAGTAKNIIDIHKQVKIPAMMSSFYTGTGETRKTSLQIAISKDYRPWVVGITSTGDTVYGNILFLLPGRTYAAVAPDSIVKILVNGDPNNYIEAYYNFDNGEGVCNIILDLYGEECNAKFNTSGVDYQVLLFAKHEQSPMEPYVEDVRISTHPI